MYENLSEFLSYLDESNVVSSEAEIYSSLCANFKENGSLEAIAEKMAFGFMESKREELSDWGTYFGPMAVWSENGKTYETPSLSLVSNDILQYWCERSSKTKNLLMKARYLGLLWDFSKHVTQKKPDFKLGFTYVEILVETIKRELSKYKTDLINKSKRAFSVSRSLNNKKLISDSIISMISLEEHIAEDLKPGLWGFSFEAFILGKEENLTTEQAEFLLSSMEARFDRLLKSSDPWAIESAGLYLAQYYRNLNSIEKANSYVTRIAESFSSFEHESPLQKSSMLQHAHDILVSYNLNKQAEDIQKKIAEVGPAVIKGLGEISHSYQFPETEINEYLESMVQGTFEESLFRIAANFFPQKGQLRLEIKKLAQDHPLCFLISKVLQDYKGRPIAKIGGIEEDLDGQIMHHMSQDMSMSGVFLRHSIKKLIERHNVNLADIMAYLYNCPLFEESQKCLVECGIQAYLNDHFIVAIHLLIPQIEAAFRSLGEIVGTTPYKKNRSGGLQLRTLDDLLRDGKIEDFFSEELIFYFRAVLTDQRGWNLRNNVCHGISRANELNYLTADRLFHVLICLAQIKKRNA